MGHYINKQLELSKIKALRSSCGNFDARMNLSEGSRADLLWWIEYITHSHKSLIVSNPEVILTTDASNIGGGGSVRWEGYWRTLEPDGTRVSYKLSRKETCTAWVKISVQRLP